MTSLLTTDELAVYLNNLEENGCTTMHDHTALTVKVFDQDETVVLQGIRKGHNQPWIVMFKDSSRIRWLGIKDGSKRDTIHGDISSLERTEGKEG